ncbi:MAG: hypothetical protein PUB37_02970 [Firmicutes bacterium]|nr:hypothetical protein [Bacillota bacterium]
MNSHVDYRKYSEGQRVMLPGWEADTEFEAVLRRPSMLALAAAGVIPNELLSCARRLFDEGISGELPMDELGRVLGIVAENSLVSPTLAELEESGVGLTDLQLAAIYNFAMTGVRSLQCFRQVAENSECDCDVG